MVFLTCVVASGPAADAYAQSDHQLELEEIFSYAVPDSFQLSGAHAASTGTLVLWAANRPYLILKGKDEQVVRSALLTHPVAAAIVASDSTLEVVDATRRSVLHLTRDGTLLAEEKLALHLEIESATRTGSGWVLGGRGVDGDYKVVLLDKHRGTSTVLHSIASRQEHPDVEVSAYLSNRGDDVIVALLQFPFDAFILDTTGKSVQDSHGIRARLPSIGSEGIPSLWISMAVLPLDTGFIRTFSDLRSDLRVVALFDDHGNNLRQLQIETPLSFVASVPETRLLIAVRRTSRIEVVGYEWRWSSGNRPRRLP